MAVTFDYNISLEQLEVLKQRQRKLKNNIKQLRDDLREDLITRDLYTETVREYTKDLNSVEADIRQIEQHDIEVKNAEDKYREYLEFIQEVDVDNLTNAVLKKLFSKIVIKKLNVANDKQAKLIVYDYNLFDMGLQELLQKAEEKGYMVDLKLSEYSIK